MMCGGTVEPDARAALLHRLCDVHCHPIDAADWEAVQQQTEELFAGALCCMSSSLGSLERTAALARHLPGKVIPAYGVHPWFCHALSVAAAPSDDVPKAAHYRELFSPGGGPPHPELTPELLAALPDPVPLPRYLSELRARLEADPAAMVGEVGLDRSFRLPRLDLPPPLPPAPGSRPLTSLRTPVSHQRAVLDAQLDLAVELGRNVSMHAVQAQAELVSALAGAQRRWGPRFGGSPLPKAAARQPRPGARDGGPGGDRAGTRVDLHSPLVSAQTLRSLAAQHPLSLYLSFSTTVCGRSPRLDELIRACPADRILVESDAAEPSGIDRALWDALERVAGAKTWTLEEAVGRLEANWNAFAKR